jgi:hypothetical protein
LHSNSQLLTITRSYKKALNVEAIVFEEYINNCSLLIAQDTEFKVNILYPIEYKCCIY